MARTKKTNSTTVNNQEAVVESTASIINSDVENNVNENTVEVVENNKQLQDTDEIEVISLIPHVSYQDNRTGDFYEWDTVGHSEFLTYETIKNMWRNSKAYFRDLWLKPLDDRVINKLGLTKNYAKYEFLMNGSNYTRSNISKICDEINTTPLGLKYSIYNKIKDLVAEGKITDISVVMTLERTFNLDLTSILG